MSNIKRIKLGAKFFWLLGMLFVTLLMLLPTAHVSGDFAAQISALKYAEEGLIDNLSTIPQIDLSDLAATQEGVQVFYPIGPILILDTLVYLGLNIGWCLKAMTCLCFVSGLAFVILLLHQIKIPNKILILTGVLLFIGSLYKKGLNPFVINTSDIFGFAFLSGGMLWAFNLLCKEKHEMLSKRFTVQLMSCSFLLGLVYFIKYSQFTYSCAIYTALILCYLISSEKKFDLYLRSIASAILFFATLATVNIYSSYKFDVNALEFTMGNFINQSPYVQSYYGDYYGEASSGKLLAISILSGPGWLNFGFPFCSDTVLRLLSSEEIVGFFNNTLHINANVALSCILGIIITMFIILIGWTYFKDITTNQKIFVVCIIIIPLILLALRSKHFGYNWLVSHEGRFGLPISVFAEGLLFSYIIQCFMRQKDVFIATALSVIFILYPMTRGSIALKKFYTIITQSDDNQAAIVYPSTFDSNGNQKTINAINGLSNNIKDIIIVAGTSSMNRKKLFCHDQVNLALGRRTLKLSDPRDIEDSIYKHLHSSENIRVIVLLHKYFTDEISFDPYDDWTMIDSGFHFEPRKRLPSVTKIITAYPSINKEVYFENLISNFDNVTGFSILDIPFSAFNIAYFNLSKHEKIDKI